MDSQFSVGQTISDWELLEWLGSGGQGEVWRATRDVDYYALKLLTNAAQDDDAFARFCREVSTLRLLGVYPGIVPLVDADVNATLPWLAMPLAVPVTKDTRTYGLGQIVEGMARVSATLAELFEQYQISHRDLHPGNIFVLDLDWCIGDFGLVRNPTEPGITGSSDTWPRVGFMAPELIDHPSIAGPPADVYSIAKCLWSLAARKRPASKSLEASDEEMAGQPSHLKAEPRWRYLMLLLEASTHQDPLERPSLDRLRDELELWGHGELGSETLHRVTYDEDFFRRTRERGIAGFELRQVVRAIWLLESANPPPSLIMEDRGGATWMATSRNVALAFLRDGSSRRLLFCDRKDPDATLFSGLFVG